MAVGVFWPQLDLQPREISSPLADKPLDRCSPPRADDPKPPLQSAPVTRATPPPQAETVALPWAPQILPPDLPWGTDSAPAGQAGPTRVPHTRLRVCPQAGAREASLFGSLQSRVCQWAAPCWHGVGWWVFQCRSESVSTGGLALPCVQTLPLPTSR